MDPLACKEYIGRFSKLNDFGVRKYVALGAFWVRPVEDVSLQLLQDDRFLSRGIELR